MEPHQRISLRLPINGWDLEIPEAVPSTSAAANSSPAATCSASTVTCASPLAVAADSAATRLRKAAAPSKAKELISLALLLQLPDRATGATICQHSVNAEASSVGAGVAATRSSRAGSSNGTQRISWGNCEQSGQSAAVPAAAAAAAATEAAAGTMRHSPRALQQQRLSSGATATRAALAAAKQRVLEKQQQLLHYLSCIATGELLLRDIKQQQERPKPPTTLSRMTGPLPQQQQHPEEQRQQRHRELMQVLRGRSLALKKTKEQPLRKWQQQQRQRLRGTKRQLPTSTLQLIYFRLQRKVEQLELLQKRQSYTQPQHQVQAKQRHQQSEQQGEQHHQWQQQQQCQEQLQQGQQKHLEQQHPQDTPAVLLQQVCRYQQQQMTRLAAQQHQREPPQNNFADSTFLTSCEDNGCPQLYSTGTAPADAAIADRASAAPFTPESFACPAVDGVAAPPASAAPKCAGIAPLSSAVVEGTSGAAAAGRSASHNVPRHIQLAHLAANAPTACPAGASVTPIAATSAAGSDGAIAPLQLPERPTPSAHSNRLSSRYKSRQRLEQLQPTGGQQQQQDRRMRLLDGQIQAFRQLLQLSKCATLFSKPKTLSRCRDASDRNSRSSSN